jgi:hypothetical protein
VQETNKKAQEQAAKLEKSARRIDELTQERTNLERTNTEL